MNFFKQYTVTLVYWYMFTSEHDGNKTNIWYCGVFFFLIYKFSLNFYGRTRHDRNIVLVTLSWILVI